MFKIVLSIYRWVFARPQFRKINLALFHMSLRGLGVLNYASHRVSGESYVIRKLLPSMLTNNNPVLFDVGANLGDYSSKLLEVFPHGKIYAFEPHPKNFARLKNTMTVDQVHCFNLALGETSGESTLYDRSDREGSCHGTLHESVITEIHGKEMTSVPVSVERLDDFCESHNIQCIDFMKIDTEGHERSVLLGAKKRIELGHIRCIQFEFNAMNVHSKVFLRDFRTILGNYDLYRLLPNGLLPLSDYAIITELFGYQNILAILRMDSRGVVSERI
jgi:FkbM family methyltransferase